MKPTLPPSSIGTEKFSAVKTKIRSAVAAVVGQTSGKVVWTAVRNAPAPTMWDASSRLPSIDCRAA